jgi:hypothetical protein
VITDALRVDVTVSQETRLANGTAMAAVLAAGVGSFAVGLFVILNEIGLFAAPALYAPAGGVSGRTAFAVVVWLIAWGWLHLRWRDRDVSPDGVVTATLTLIALGILLTFPPLWGLF